ncbi:MAG: 3-carboxy-cis,cis-muconate cycloisomerase, partial [Kribbellaceae bacterium]|nr:3-carboxy-cis,cis-muconate cycloisomerase [Kribbellaceae bacterium]
MHHLRESAEANLGDEASWIHYGATSQDILDTAMMLLATNILKAVTEDLTALADSLTALVIRYRNVPAVARTLGQQALPTSLGLRIAG